MASDTVLAMNEVTLAYIYLDNLVESHVASRGNMDCWLVLPICRLAACFLSVKFGVSTNIAGDFARDLEAG